MIALLAAGATPAFLPGLAALVIAAAGIAYVSTRFHQVPIVGFLLAGVLIGPYALGFVASPEAIETEAEIGVILLLFTIGIEFSLERLAQIRRLIAVGGWAAGEPGDPGHRRCARAVRCGGARGRLHRISGGAVVDGHRAEAAG